MHEDHRLAIPVWQMVKEAVTALNGHATYKQIIDWIKSKYGDVNEGTIRAQTIICTVNQPSRVHYPENKKPRKTDERYDFLYSVGRGEVTFYNPKIHGNWEIIEHDGKLTIAKDGIHIENHSITESPLLKFLKSKMGMRANYQPIVIKTLLEKGNDSAFTATIQEIKDKIQELNFERHPILSDAIRAVTGALKEFVTFDDQDASLHLDQFSSEDIPECLKICGQKIARWHVYELTDHQFDLWSILPGSTKEDFPFLEEFLQTNSIGIGWSKVGDISNRSEKKVREEFHRQYEGEDESSFIDFTRIKQKDLIMLTRGQQEIVDFGIVVGGYYHHDAEHPSYPHRKNVRWLNQGPIKSNELPKPTLAGFMTTCSRVVKRKEEMIEVLLGKHTMAALKAHSCFILTQNPDSKYDDIEGEQHQYDSQVPNSRKLLEDSKFIIQSKIDNENYFVGHGRIENIEESQETNEKGKSITKFVAKFLDYQKFEPPKLRTNEIYENMKSMKAYGSMPPSILPITRQLFAKIIGEDIDDTQVEKLSMESDFAKILRKKKQLIFYGPPGTGKTYTAKLLADSFVKNNSSTPTLTFREAAIKILKDEGKPMHYEEITKRALEQNLIQTKGETPEFTMLKEMSKEIQILGDAATFTRPDSGTYGLNPDIDIKPELNWHKNSKINHKFIRSVTFHQSYSYEEFIEGLRPQSINKQVVYNIEPGIFKILCEDAEADPDNKYVLLIDELNRGNISKIFGELITLIEKDKRGDVIQLAYSKEDFSVPENLYIIGTMNTADRSLVQIDAALRRRFAFCELMPKSELLDQKIEGISLRDLLDEMNKRIVEAGLREKQIGHSYLLDVKDLENLQFVFANEIVPLLQDYFFDDYKKLEEDILSSDFIDSEKMIIKDDWRRDPQKFLESLKNTFQL